MASSLNFAVGIREVSRLERIVLEVVQLVWREWRIVYQFPVPRRRRDSPARCVKPLRAGQQGRGRTSALGRAWSANLSFDITRHFGSCHGTGCGIQIHRNADEVAAGSGLDFAGQTAQVGTFRPPSYISCFSSTMITVSAADVDLTAVVAAENRQRVFVLSVFLQGIDHLPDAVVHVLDERDAWLACR